ncbi:MAG TPA: hypothetical protein VEA38_00865 [Terriglobales bacterium]|nr:hypothetical protein [Terriglobales bacterium]
MATVFYWTTRGDAAARPIYGVHPDGNIAVPAGVAALEVAGAPHEIVWPVPANATQGCEAWTVVDTTSAPALRVNPSLALPSAADTFEAERWLKATNLYWQDVTAQLVQALNQVRTDPLTPKAAVSAPTVAEVKAGVVAKYQALG